MIKILIVDDEVDVCSFAKSFFEMRGLKVYSALSGIEALNIFLKERPNIVLIDVKMKGMDGVTLLKQIKSIDKDCEAIMVSAIGDMNVIEEARRYGAKDYITKPLVLEELEKTVLEKVKWMETHKKTI
ncbi:MAG: response regulator [Candidatus Omnitrophica bacterium]|nr:response regulator [Candidatus Omnitrophota bacterium]